jgi:hypothetical protein
MRAHCCQLMHKQLTDWHCEIHQDRYKCPDALIDYLPVFDEYSIIVHDGGTSSVVIHFCPWCGAKLPPSKRARWFEEVEALGFSNPEDSHIPGKYRTDEWYRPH